MLSLCWINGTMNLFYSIEKPMYEQRLVLFSPPSYSRLGVVHDDGEVIGTFSYIVS